MEMTARLAVELGLRKVDAVKPQLRTACLAILAFAAARAETWQTPSGPIEGTLSAVYGPIAAISIGHTTSLLPVTAMSDAELERVADFVAREPASATTWSSSKSTLAKALLRNLEILKNGRLVPYDPGTRPEPDFYVIYFGAGWCPPCREFSHRFVPTYARLQQLAHGRFEVIFLSSDRSVEEMETYVKNVGMPWPVLAPEDRGHVHEVERFEAESIPCIAVLTRDGTLLYHSHHGSEYMGPDKPIEQLEALLTTTLPGNPATRRPMHRLAVFERVRAAGNRSLNPKPYDVHLDLSKYQTLEAKSLTVTLELDDKGCVTSADFEPKQSAVIDYNLVNDAADWLFLPAVRDGHAVPTKVVMPLQLRR